MPPAPGTEDLENILFVFTDQQRQDSLNCYGGIADTPTLDGLAEVGARFDRAYTPAAICSPARAAVVSGIRPHRNGITRNVDDEVTLADDWPCYPGILREAGYNTGHVGKWHLGQPPADFGLDGEHYPGWFYPEDHPDYEAYLDENGYEPLDRSVVEDVFPETEGFRAGGLDTRPKAASFTHFITERAIERLEEYAAADRPFYQGVHYYGPHNPYYLPEEYLYMYDPDDVTLSESAVKEVFDRKPHAHQLQYEVSGLWAVPLSDWRRIIAAYMGWVTFIDDEIGRLLDALDRLGVADSTAIVFSSDHGAFLTRHKMHDKGPAMYEDIYNVPFVASGLDIDRETAAEAFVNLLDLAPTFADIAGVEIPDEWEGRSLCNLRDGLEAADWREEILAEFHGHQFPYEQRMLRTDRYKFVLNQHDTAELYDLEADPEELHNRIGDSEYGAVAQRLHRRLRDRLTDAGDDTFPRNVTKLSGTVW